MSTITKIENVEDFIGQETGVGDWVVMSQDRINQFADVTEDHQFIHIDVDRAKETMFGGTIAHGFLTLSMLAKLCEDAILGIEGTTMGVNYGFESVRFLAPVPSGSRIRARAELTEATVKGGGKRVLLNSKITVEIEGSDRPALIAQWLTMAMTG